MKELKKYFREIKNALPCGGREQKKFIRDLQLSVENFLQENPDATFEAVTDHFGTPEEIAGSYAEVMPPQKLRRKLKIRRWVIGIIAGAAACALIMWLIAIGIALKEHSKYAGGSLEVEAPVEEKNIVIEEDVVVEENVGEASDLEG